MGGLINVARKRVTGKKTPNFLSDLKTGALHKALKKKPGESLSAKDLTIKKTDSPLMRKRKQFAINAAKWKHTGRKKTQ